MEIENGSKDKYELGADFYQNRIDTINKKLVIVPSGEHKEIIDLLEERSLNQVKLKFLKIRQISKK